MVVGSRDSSVMEPLVYFEGSRAEKPGGTFGHVSGGMLPAHRHVGCVARGVGGVDQDVGGPGDTNNATVEFGGCDGAC